MIVMPSNASGWFWHSLARETGRLGHLFSPLGQRGPWPWLPYACDNGAYPCADPKTKVFDYAKWAVVEPEWRRLLMWGQCAPMKPMWQIVPDVPFNSAATLARWPIYAPEVVEAGFPLALAVQDGMTVEDVNRLSPAPDVICVGGSDEWKWATVGMWAEHFPRVHLLRCNAPDKLDYLQSLGVESTDGTGWNRGDRKQTAGLETWCRRNALPTYHNEPLWPHVCRAKSRTQMSFA